jgi:hypothetical protein
MHWRRETCWLTMRMLVSQAVLYFAEWFHAKSLKYITEFIPPGTQITADSDTLKPCSDITLLISTHRSVYTVGNGEHAIKVLIKLNARPFILFNTVITYTAVIRCAFIQVPARSLSTHTEHKDNFILLRYIARITHKHNVSIMQFKRQMKGTLTSILYGKRVCRIYLQPKWKKEISGPHVQLIQDMSLNGHALHAEEKRTTCISLPHLTPIRVLKWHMHSRDITVTSIGVLKWHMH